MSLEGVIAGGTALKRLPAADDSGNASETVFKLVIFDCFIYNLTPSFSAELSSLLFLRPKLIVFFFGEAFTVFKGQLLTGVLTCGLTIIMLSLLILASSEGVVALA